MVKRYVARAAVVFGMLTLGGAAQAEPDAGAPASSAGQSSERAAPPSAAPAAKPEPAGSASSAPAATPSERKVQRRSQRHSRAQAQQARAERAAPASRPVQITPVVVTGRPARPLANVLIEREQHRFHSGTMRYAPADARR